MLLRFTPLIIPTLLCLCLLSPPARSESSALAPPTWERMATTSGQLAGASQATWDRFLGQTPKWVGICATALSAVDIHAKLSNGDPWGAARSFGELGGGMLLSEWAAAGGPPLATITGVFSAYVAANDFIRDRWFLPELVNSLQGAYDTARREGETAQGAWESIRYGRGLQPVLAEVKRRVIRPSHGLDGDQPDLSRGSRTVTASVAGRELRLTWIPPERWTLGRPVVIRHKGTDGGQGPRFTRIIDVELTGTPGAVRETILHDITKLNERYGDRSDALDSAGLAAVEGAVDDLLDRLSQPGDLGREMDAEAQAYVARMLETRHAQAFLLDGLNTTAAVQRGRLDAARSAYATWLAILPPEPDGAPFLDLPCCRYWAVVDAKGGHRITGSYLNAAGERIHYTSDPIANFQAAIPGAGLFALSSGIGYHMYALEDGTPPQEGRIMVIARLGDRVTTLFRERVRRWSCQEQAPDLSWMRCAFERTAGQRETLTLR